MDYDVFISYRRDPCGWLAVHIKTQLETTGISCFLDCEDLDKGRFDSGIEQAIVGCRNFLLVLTPGALERLLDPTDWMAKEVLMAHDLGKHVVVVRSDVALDPSRSQLPRSIAMINCIDFTYGAWRAALVKLRNSLILPEQQRAAHRLAKVQHAHGRMADLDAVLANPAYIRWRDRYLQNWLQAQPILTELAQWPAVLVWPEVAGTRYPVLCFPSANPQLDFRQGADFGKLIEATRSISAPIGPQGIALPEWIGDGPLGSMRSEYYETLNLSDRVKRWNMPGFHLASLRLDSAGRVTGFEADLSTYAENCLTSHLASYGLYLQYLAEDRRPSPVWEPELERADIAASCRPSLQKPRPCGSDEFRALELDMPGGFFPQISVQAMVLCRDPDSDENEWKVVAMERGTNVAAAAGFWQFPPAGGFEIFGREEGEGNLWIHEQFDIRKALIREFLEEIFGDMDMACDVPDNGASHPHASPGYLRFTAAVKAKRVGIHFLGVVTELINLRSEFSFLIVIEDPDILTMTYDVFADSSRHRQARWLQGSAENKKGRLNLIPLGQLGGHLRRHERWHTSSVGMALLADAQAKDPEGWLCRRYPGMPDFNL